MSIAISKDNHIFGCIDMPVVKGNLFQDGCLYISNKHFSPLDLNGVLALVKSTHAWYFPTTLFWLEMHSQVNCIFLFSTNRFLYLYTRAPCEYNGDWLYKFITTLSETNMKDLFTIILLRDRKDSTLPALSFPCYLPIICLSSHIHSLHLKK